MGQRTFLMEELHLPHIITTETITIMLHQHNLPPLFHHKEQDTIILEAMDMKPHRLEDITHQRSQAMDMSEEKDQNTTCMTEKWITMETADMIMDTPLSHHQA